MAMAELRALRPAERPENFGVAVVEAMAAGCPVIVSREVAIAPDIEVLGRVRRNRAARARGVGAGDRCVAGG